MATSNGLVGLLCFALMAAAATATQFRVGGDYTWAWAARPGPTGLTTGRAWAADLGPMTVIGRAWATDFRVFRKKARPEARRDFVVMGGPGHEI